MAEIQLMQTELTYNITTDDGKGYTAILMEDMFSGYFSIDILDDEEEMVEDEKKILEISTMIENIRS